MILDSLKIEGFKLFGHLELPELRRVNLIVGKNNSGKTCLLEAIRLYAGDADPRVIRNIVKSRDGDWEANISTPAGLDPGLFLEIEDPVRTLFTDSHLRDHAVIEIGTSSGKRKVQISVGPYRHSRSSEGVSQYEAVKNPREFPSDDVTQMVALTQRDGHSALQKLESFWTRDSNGIRMRVGESPETPVVFVSAGGLQPAEVGFLYNHVSLTTQEDDIRTCLRLIEPQLDGLALIDNPSTRGLAARTPIVRLKGRNSRYPLRTMGDGLTRLFHLALAIVNAQGGVVLIDEFENGLHWEVQEQLWPVIFKMAEDFDVQVFATSHSQDCLRSFTAAWCSSPDEGSVYRLERNQGSSRAFKLPMVNLSDALASQVEVR